MNKLKAQIRRRMKLAGRDVMARLSLQVNPAAPVKGTFIAPVLTVVLQ